MCRLLCKFCQSCLQADRTRRVWEPTYVIVYREAKEGREEDSPCPPLSSSSRRGSSTLPQLPITANTQCRLDEVMFQFQCRLDEVIVSSG